MKRMQKLMRKLYNKFEVLRESHSVKMGGTRIYRCVEPSTVEEAPPGNYSAHLRGKGTAPWGGTC